MTMATTSSASRSVISRIGSRNSSVHLFVISWPPALQNTLYHKMLRLPFILIATLYCYQKRTKVAPSVLLISSRACLSIFFHGLAHRHDRHHVHRDPLHCVRHPGAHRQDVHHRVCADPFRVPLLPSNLPTQPGGKAEFCPAGQYRSP